MSMSQLRILPSLVGVLALLAGCGSSSKPDDARGNVLLSDDNNYITTARLAVPTVETAAATDLDICWTDVTTDIQCHPVSATADLDNVSLLRISHLSEEQVEDNLAAGTLTQAQVAGYLDFQTDHTTTCAKLSQRPNTTSTNGARSWTASRSFWARQPPTAICRSGRCAFNAFMSPRCP